MKKDGIQTRNRKLATKAKRRKSFMHDFFRSSFDSRFMYSNMGPSYLAAAAATNPMSQYYAGQMSAMQPFMGTANSPSAASVVSPLGHTASPLMPTVSTPSLSNTSTSSPSPSMGHHHVSSSAESAAAVAAAASFSPYLTGNSAAAAAATMPVVGASA